MAGKVHDSNDHLMKNENTEETKSKQHLYSEAPQENLTVFTCLIDMIALEEGVFGSGTSTSRIARAHRNLQNGLQLKDGSIFRYNHTNGPSLDYYEENLNSSKEPATDSQEIKRPLV